MLTTTSLIGGGGGTAAVPPSMVYVGAPTPITTNGSTFTFSDADLGTPAAGRKIVIVSATYDVANGDISSVTIAGSTAANRINTRFYSSVLSIDDIEDATNSTGDIVVTYTSSKGGCTINVYNLFGFATGTPSDTGVSSQANPTAPTLTIPAGGACIGGSLRTSDVSTTWVNLATEDYDASTEGLGVSSASELFATLQTELAITASMGANCDGVTVAYAVA